MHRLKWPVSVVTEPEPSELARGRVVLEEVLPQDGPAQAAQHHLGTGPAPETHWVRNRMGEGSLSNLYGKPSRRFWHRPNASAVVPRELKSL